MITIKSLTSSEVTDIISTAQAKAAELSLAVSIAVVDKSGDLLGFQRMDGASFLSGKTAQDKAWTAAGYATPTHEIYDFIKNDQALSLGVPSIERLLVIGGGYPIMVDGKLVGAIGVGGGHYTEDTQIAEAGLSSLK